MGSPRASAIVVGDDNAVGARVAAGDGANVAVGAGSVAVTTALPPTDCLGENVGVGNLGAPSSTALVVGAPVAAAGSSAFVGAGGRAAGTGGACVGLGATVGMGADVGNVLGADNTAAGTVRVGARATS